MTLRWDIATNDWVIFAPSRALRPQEFTHHHSAGDSASSDAHFRPDCPFCPGNEKLTPTEISAIRDTGQRDSPGWKVRVIPNKFPALRIEEDHRRVQNGALFRSMGGCGAHEVIIDSPDHNTPLALQPVDQIVLILRMMQERYNDLMRDSRFQTIVIFKNHGLKAGTSLAHPHCQLIATPVTPRSIRYKLATAAQYFDETGDCLYCSMLARELEDGVRILDQNAHFVALLPYASHVPFEIMLLPRLRQSSFRWVDPSFLRPLAEILKSVLLRLHIGLDDPDFNLTIDTAPRGDEDAQYFMWHIAILPRITTTAGFELGSGMSINTVLPEAATDYLRSVKMSDAK
jgi:UDPglucose--hexose-1-phosphate uridylyltransferase